MTIRGQRQRSCRGPLSYRIANGDITGSSDDESEVVQQTFSRKKSTRTEMAKVKAVPSISDAALELGRLHSKEVKKMKVVELKAELSKLGCKVSGRKAELVERLLLELARESSNLQSNTSDDDSLSSVQDDATVNHEKATSKSKKYTKRGQRKFQTLQNGIEITSLSDNEDPQVENFDTSRLLKSCSQSARNEFRPLSTLGAEGKDGQVFLVLSLKDGQKYAMKVFKPTKSTTNIRKEIAFQKKAAALGLAPKIVSTWSIDANNRCFVMEKLYKTLEDVIMEQNKTLKSSQAKQIEKLVRDLSAAEILHNDDNIGKNMMMDHFGTFKLIDFGMSKIIDSKILKKKGNEPNLGLLGQIDRMLKKSVFSSIIKKYESEAGVVVDARAAARQKIIDRKKKKLEAMRLRV